MTMSKLATYQKETFNHPLTGEKCTIFYSDKECHIHHFLLNENIRYLAEKMKCRVQISNIRTTIWNDYLGICNVSVTAWMFKWDNNYISYDYFITNISAPECINPELNNVINAETIMKIQIPLSTLIPLFTKNDY